MSNSVNLLERCLVAESNCVHQDELKDQGVFMLSLASLIELETSFDDDLLDLYLYYCVVGLGMASPRLQSAALAMLQSCAVQQPALVVAKLPLVNTLCKRCIHARPLSHAHSHSHSSTHPHYHLYLLL